MVCVLRCHADVIAAQFTRRIGDDRHDNASPCTRHFIGHAMRGRALGFRYRDAGHRPSVAMLTLPPRYDRRFADEREAFS